MYRVYRLLVYFILVMKDIFGYCPQVLMIIYACAPQYRSSNPYSRPPGAPTTTAKLSNLMIRVLVADLEGRQTRSVCAEV